MVRETKLQMSENATASSGFEYNLLVKAPETGPSAWAER